MSEPTTPTTVETVVPAGYVLRWERPTYDLLKKTGEVEGSPWIVACKLHGTTHDVATQGAGDKAGRKVERVEWCAGCKADADAAPAKTTTAAKPGTVKVPVHLTVEVDVSKWSGEDAEKLAALVESIKTQTGADDDRAGEIAALVMSKVKDTAEVKAEIAAWVLEQVKGLDRISETEAVVTLK